MNEEVEEIVIEEPDYTVAEVAGVYSDGLTLIFPGAEEASEKHYKCNADVVYQVGDRVKITKDGDTYIVEYIIGNPAEEPADTHGIPSGGAANTFLGKNSSTSYDVSWKAIHELPSGGTTDQVLAKNSNTAYDTKWITPTHDIASGGTTNQFLAKNSATDYDTKWVNAPVPTGGTAGQVLAKKTATNYDTEWVNQSGVPSGGTTGQVLTKTSTASAWQDVPHEIPTGGSNNQVLTKNGTTNYSVKWADVPSGLPTGGTSGQVLTKNSATNYDVKWAAVTATSTNSVANYYSASSALNTAYNIYFKTDATYNPSKLYWRMGTSGTWHELT